MRESMRTWFATLLALASLAVPLVAQKAAPLTEEQARKYQASFQSAITAHQAGKYDEAIAGFQACLAILPEDPASAYNIACGHSLKKDLDRAFEWLEKAVDWGFGSLNIDEDEIALAEKRDADMANLRADPRFAKAVERMKARAKAIDDYTSRPVVYVPDAIQAAAEKGVLVVLHGEGATKEALAASYWKEVADDLGLALIVPSARVPMKKEPEQGTAWFADPDFYQQNAWKYERTIQAAYDAFQKGNPVDKSRVFLAGEGQGGVVAFNAAISAPGLYKGVVAFDSPVNMELAAKKAANAAKMGFRAKLFEDLAGIYGIGPGEDVKAFAEHTASSLAGMKLANVAVTTYAKTGEEGDPHKRLALEALREFMTPPQPAEAAAPE